MGGGGGGGPFGLTFVLSGLTLVETSSLCLAF